MSLSTVLNIFQESQPVTASIVTTSGERFQIHGVAQLTESPYLQFKFPKSNLSEIRKIDKKSNVIVCSEIDYSVLTLYTFFIDYINHNSLLLKIDHHDQKKQKRIANRFPVHEVWAEFWAVDESGHSLHNTKYIAEAVNISKTGILLTLHDVVEPNQRVHLSILLPGIRLITSYGRVVRLALLRSGKIELAVRFEDVPDSDQSIINQYCKDIEDK